MSRKDQEGVRESQEGARREQETLGPAAPGSPRNALVNTVRLSGEQRAGVLRQAGQKRGRALCVAGPRVGAGRLWTGPTGQSPTARNTGSERGLAAGTKARRKPVRDTVCPGSSPTAAAIGQELECRRPSRCEDVLGGGAETQRPEQRGWGGQARGSHRKGPGGSRQPALQAQAQGQQMCWFGSWRPVPGYREVDG